MKMLHNSRILLRKQPSWVNKKTCLHSRNLKVSSELDFNYLCNPNNTPEIKVNIERRKGSGDITQVLSLYDSYLNSDPAHKENIYSKLAEEAFKIPNRAHPDILSMTKEPRVVREVGQKTNFEHKPLKFEDIARKNNLVRTENITNFTGPRSYFLLDQLALLEEALIQYSLNSLLLKGFELISVPDILPRQIIESCGMETRSERNQVIYLS